MSDTHYRPRIHYKRQYRNWEYRSLLIAARTPACDPRDPEAVAPKRALPVPDDAATVYVDGLLIRL